MSRQETVLQDAPEATPSRALELGHVRGGRSTIVNLIRAMRPRQWLKNGLVFVALIFSIERSWSLLEPDDW